MGKRLLLIAAPSNLLEKRPSLFSGESIVQSFLLALAQKDLETAKHCLRVGFYSRKLAEAIQLSAQESYIAEYSGKAHDIGKVGIPDAILLKPGKLTPEELHIMQEHPVRGYEMLLPFKKDPLIREILPAVRSHHERIDGMGYPDRLSDKNIPFFARIVLIADSFDAITSNRSYRRQQSVAFAMDELYKNANKQFQADLVNTFLKYCEQWKNNINDDWEELRTNALEEAA